MAVDQASDQVAALIKAAAEEQERRRPGFFAERVLTVPRIRDISLDDRPEAPLLARSHAIGELAEAALVRELGGRGRFEFSSASSPIGAWLSLSALDAAVSCATGQDLHAIPMPQRQLAETVEQKCGATGLRYLQGCGSGPLMVLINAGGVPLRIWSRLLSDSSLGFQVIAPQLNCRDPLDGGQSEPGSVFGDAEAVATLIAEYGRPCTVLTWSNGCRVGVSLARRAPRLVERLILLSPTFHGSPRFEDVSCAYGRTMSELLHRVATRPELASVMSQIIARHVLDPPSAKGSDVAHFMSLPARDAASLIAAPMSQPESLLHYAVRQVEDEAHDALEDLQKLTCELVLIVGEYDNVATPEVSRTALMRAGCRFLDIFVTAAGHYIHDLQYNHLRYILRSLRVKQRLSSMRLITTR